MLREQIQSARDGGYSDDEIAAYLQENHADLAPGIQSALKDGYSHTEVLDYLGTQYGAVGQQPTPQPEPAQPTEKSWGDALADAYHGLGGALAQTGVDIATLVPKAAAYLGTAMGTGDRELAKQAFEQKYNYELPSARPEAKQRYMEGISTLFAPIAKAAEYMAPSTRAEDYPAWEDIADMPGPVHPIQKDIQRALTELALFHATGTGASKLFKTGSGVPERGSVADIAKADKEIARLGVKETPDVSTSLKAMEHRATQPTGTIGEKVAATAQRAKDIIGQKERGFELVEGGKLETGKKSPWSPEVAEGVKQAKSTLFLEDTGADIRAKREAETTRLQKTKLEGGRGTVYTAETPGRGVPMQMEPAAPEPVMHTPQPQAPAQTSRVFSRLEDPRLQPQPEAPAPVEATPDVAVQNLQKRFLEQRGAVPTDTTGDIGKMGRFRTGERVPERQVVAQEPVISEPVIEEKPMSPAEREAFLKETAEDKIEAATKDLERDKTVKVELREDVRKAMEDEPIEVVETGEGVPTENLSGEGAEGAGSTEAIRRDKAEKLKGRNRYRIKQNGEVIPLKGVDAVDAVANKGEVIIQEGVAKGDKPAVLSVGDGASVTRAMKDFEARGKKPKAAEPLKTSKEAEVYDLDVEEAKADKKLKEQKVGTSEQVPTKREFPKQEKVELSETSKLTKKNAKSIAKELRKNLDEMGFDAFQDVFNDGKVTAKLYQELKESGMEAKEAKAQATKMSERYVREYKKVTDLALKEREARRGGDLKLKEKTFSELEDMFNDLMADGKDKGDPVYDAVHEEIHDRVQAEIREAEEILASEAKTPKAKETVEQESTRLADAIAEINEELARVGDVFTEEQAIKTGYVKEGTPRVEKLREHDIFSEFAEGEIPEHMTMSIDAMTSKEIRRLLEARDKQGIYDWGSIGKRDLKAYIKAKYGTNKGRTVHMTPEEFLDVRGRDKIKYEDLQRQADIGGSMKDLIERNYSAHNITLDFLGLQTMYESIAKRLRNKGREEGVYTRKRVNQLKKSVHRVAQDIWGEKNYITEYDKVKRQLFGKKVSAKNLNGHELKILEDHLTTMRDKVYTTKPGNKGKVVRKKIGVSNYYGEGKHLYRPSVSEYEANIVKRTKELSDNLLRKWRYKDPKTDAATVGVFETPLRVFEELGPIKGLIYDPIKDAIKVAKQKHTALMTEFKDVTKSMSRKQQEKITAYAIGKQKNGMAILESMGREMPTLDAAEMKVYNYMRKHFEQMYKDVNAARVKAGLKEMPKTKDYFTFWRVVQEMAEEGVVMSDKAFAKRYSKAKETPFRFKKKRGNLVADVRLDGFNVFDQYMKTAMEHAETTPHIAKGRELLGRMDDGFALWESRPYAHNFLTEWLDTAAGKPRTEQVKGIKKAGAWISNNLTAAVLSYNIRSALIQPSAIVATYADIGGKYTRRGIKNLFDDAKMDFAERHSNVINRDFDVHITDLMSKAGKARAKAAQFGMKGLQWLDKQTAMATWSGSYDFAIERLGKNNKEAIRFADDAVTRTQASAHATDLSPIQRMTGGKLATLFQTFVINHAEFLLKDVAGYGKKMSKAEVARKAGRYILGVTLFNAFYEDILGINSPFPTPIRSFIDSYDEGDTVGLAAAKGAREFMDLVPVLSSLRYGSSIGGPIVELGSDIGAKISGQKGPTRSWADIAGRVAGVPGTAQISKTLNRLEKGEGIAESLIGVRPPKKKSSVFGRKRTGRTERKGRRSR